MELCRTSLFICFKSMKWRRFSSKHSLERALNSLQSNWLFQPKFSISRDSALANILRICSDITHDSQYFRNVNFSCPTPYSCLSLYLSFFLPPGLHATPPGQFPERGPKPSKLSVLLYLMSIVFCCLGIIALCRYPMIPVMTCHPRSMTIMV